MTIRNLLNAYLNEFTNIILMRFIGDSNDIGADLDNDYSVAGKFERMKDIPDYLLEIRVEYFGAKDGNIIIYMEA